MPLDPSTIPAPPKPTATSTAAEWSNYIQYTRVLAEIELSAAADRQSAQLAAVAASQTEMAAAIRETGLPPSITETSFLEVLKILKPAA